MTSGSEAGERLKLRGTGSDILYCLLLSKF